MVNPSIYLVEDDETLAEGLSLLLIEEGYGVMTFMEEKELQSALQTDVPDLFIMDYRLPGRNGLEIASSLKELPHTKKIPILLISATHLDLTKTIEEKGVNAYLSKPFAIEVFLTTVKRLIHKH